MDEDIGRFTSIDPLWEKQYEWSPYHYCSNNQVMGNNKISITNKRYLLGKLKKLKSKKCMI